MTAEAAQELRAICDSIEYDYGAEGDRLSRLIKHVRSTLPAPPERRWPEGMAAWEVGRWGGSQIGDDTKPYTCLFVDRAQPTVRVSHKYCSPTQADRILRWVQHAERLETAMFAYEAERGNHTNKSPADEDLYNAIAAYKAEEGEG